jgi:hypothetical protein
MFDYVHEIISAINKAEPKRGGTKSSAAPDDLFKVNEDRKKLVNIRYFFITDHVDKGDVSLVRCTTREMIGDFMT